MMAGFSLRLLGILFVVVAVLSSPLSAYVRRRSQLDSIYRQHSRRSYVRSLCCVVLLLASSY